MVTLSLRVLSHSTAIEPLLDIPPTRGSIHSVFPRAANLLLGGRLLTLHARATPCAPNGLVLALRATQRPLADLQPGMAIIIERGTIFIPAPALRLSLQQSLPWNPRPPLVNIACTPALLQRNLARLEALLAAHASGDGLAPLANLHLASPLPAAYHSSRLLHTAGAAAGSLLEGIARQQIHQVRQSASTLIGLGPGLTPSGDDLLIGLIAATTLLSEPLGRSAEFYQRLSTEILAIAHTRTNKLSITWMEHASRGEVAEHLGQLFQALVRDDAHALEEAALAVLSSGATSGGDMLTGIILGGRCLIEQENSKWENVHHDIHGQ